MTRQHAARKYKGFRIIPHPDENMRDIGIKWLAVGSGLPGLGSYTDRKGWARTLEDAKFKINLGLATRGIKGLHRRLDDWLCSVIYDKYGNDRGVWLTERDEVLSKMSPEQVAARFMTNTGPYTCLVATYRNGLPVRFAEVQEDVLVGSDREDARPVPGVKGEDMGYVFFENQTNYRSLDEYLSREPGEVLAAAQNLMGSRGSLEEASEENENGIAPGMG